MAVPAVPLAIGATLFQTGVSMYSQNKAAQAADAQAKHEQQLLANRRDAERDALKKNTSKMLSDKRRKMAEVHAQQAARGFARSGTQLAVFGEIDDRLDEQIEATTNQALDRVAQYGNQIAMSKFDQKQRKSAAKMDMFSTALGGAVSAGFRGYQTKQKYGDQPFKIF